MKKIVMVAIAGLLVLVGGYNALKNYIKLPVSDTATQQSQPPITTQAPTLFDSINQKLVDIETYESIDSAKSDQIISLLEQILAILKAK